jgi:hypothetical protein
MRLLDKEKNNKITASFAIPSVNIAAFVLLAVILLFFSLAGSAHAEFGLQRFALSARNENGTPDIQAGSHPWALTNTFVVNMPTEEAHLRDVKVELPPGFVGDPNATPRCTYQEFITLVHQESSCSNETAIGLSTTYLGEHESPDSTGPSTDAVYNLVPPAGVAAEFGFIVAEKTPVLLQTSVRSGSDYGLTTTVPDISEDVTVAASKVTIWGVPASPAHNPWRGSCISSSGTGGTVEEVGNGLREGEDELEGPLYYFGKQTVTGLPESDGVCATQAPVIPLLTNPTSCGTPRTATESVDDWEEPGVYHSKTVSLPEIAGCEKLDFSPTVTVKPDLPDASTASGLTIDIKVPQGSTTDPVGLGEADVRNATFVLPPGVALNPSAGNGLESCSANPAALAAGELGSPGDGIGYEGVKPSTQPGQSELGFSAALPGSIAAVNGVSTGALGAGENLLQPGVNFCSNASKVGTVRIKTPLLPNELNGAIYLAAQEANPYGSVFAQYLVVEDPVSGAMVKLPGEITLCKGAGEDPVNGAGEPIPGVTCQAVGQVVGTFLNDPQLPAEELEVHYFGGEKAPLTTPSHCGTYTMQQSFVPWSGEPAAHPSAEFTIEHGPGGGPCPDASLPFSPSATAGSTNVNAGAFSPFTLTMTRKDGEQNLQSVVATLPPGLSGILSNIELCPEPQANEGECGPNSLIGETTASVGVGGDPYTVTGGRDYLTGPYNGSGGCTVGQAGCAPFGLTFEVPAKAGPFDLANTKNNHPACDCILVRGKIEVNPLTAALTITSNPPGTPDSIPTSIEGIPLEIQQINATTTRGNFQFNPTNCSKMEAVGTIESSEKATDTIKVPYQVTNCQALKFTPKFTVSTSGKTSKANGADLVTKVEEPAGSMGTQANLTKVKVELPKQLPSRLTTLQKACTDKQFEANPAGCPSESKIGYAVVHTPLVPVPLEGPAIFVSHGGEAFPSLTMVLQGYGVTIDLVGTTFISKSGITSTTFKTVPDQPFSSFQLTLPEGKFSALAANGNLCKETKTVTSTKKETKRVKGKLKKVTVKVKKTEAVALTMPTEFIAQNGAEIKETTPITVTSCAKAKPAKKAKTKKSKKRKKGGKK